MMRPATATASSVSTPGSNSPHDARTWATVWVRSNRYGYGVPPAALMSSSCARRRAFSAASPLPRVRRRRVVVGGADRWWSACRHSRCCDGIETGGRCARSFRSWCPTWRRQTVQFPVVRPRFALGLAALLVSSIGLPVAALGGSIDGPAVVDTRQASRRVRTRSRATSSASTTPVDLRPDVANAAMSAARQAGATIAFGRSASVGMVGVYRGSAPVQLPQPGFSFPMGTTVLPPEAVGATMGRDVSALLASDALVMGADHCGPARCAGRRRAAARRGWRRRRPVPNRGGPSRRAHRRHRTADVTAGGRPTRHLRPEPGTVVEPVIAGSDGCRARGQRARVDIDQDPPELGSAGPRRHDRNGPDQGAPGRVHLSGQCQRIGQPERCVGGGQSPRGTGVVERFDSDQRPLSQRHRTRPARGAGRGRCRPASAARSTSATPTPTADVTSPGSIV